MSQKKLRILLTARARRGVRSIYVSAWERGLRRTADSSPSSWMELKRICVWLWPEQKRRAWYCTVPRAGEMQ
jgi:hypothetical protein